MTAYNFSEKKFNHILKKYGDASAMIYAINNNERDHPAVLRVHPLKITPEKERMLKPGDFNPKAQPGEKAQKKEASKLAAQQKKKAQQEEKRGHKKTKKNK